MSRKQAETAGTASGCWVFSNKAAGAFDGNVWDMQATVETHRYYLRRNENNCGKVSVGDVGYMREYGQGYLGKFVIAASWEPDPDASSPKAEAGFFIISAPVLWHRPVPQSLIIGDLSNRDMRHRLIAITTEDAQMIETAHHVYERLGFGAADGKIVLLERGLEEAIKANLAGLGLRPASEKVHQQFSRGPGVGRSDLICMDENDDFVVIELKRGRSSSEVIGQLATYVGYVKENIASKGQAVHGWIITGDYDESLRLAAQAVHFKVLVVRLP